MLEDQQYQEKKTSALIHQRLVEHWVLRPTRRID